MRKLAAVVALLCVFGLGMSFAILGAISVNLMPHLNIDEGQFGTLIMVFMLSCLVMSLIIGLLVDMWGHKPLAILGFIVASLSFFLIGAANTTGLAIVAVLLLGAGAMCLNTAGNTLIPVVLFEGKNPAAASNFGNVFFGLGLFITPLLSAWLFTRFPDDYQRNISIIAIVILIPVIVAILAQYPVVKTGFNLSEGASLLAQPAVIVAGLTLFVYIAIEASLTNWVTPYGKEIIESASPEMAGENVDAKAKWMMSAFAIAMMAGRLIASQVKAITRIGDKVVAGVGLVVAIVVLVMMRSSSEPLAWVLVVLAGLACAPGFPTTAGVTFSKFQPRVYGSVFGMIFAIGLAGAVIVPKLIGAWAKERTVQGSLGILIPVAAALIVFALILGAVKAKGDVAAKPEGGSS